MNQQRLIDGILAVLKDVAPDAEVGRLDPKRSFRDQFDLDSVDYLNFVMALEAAFAIRIPDADYPKLSTLAGCVAYRRGRAILRVRSSPSVAPAGIDGSSGGDLPTLA